MPKAAKKSVYDLAGELSDAIDAELEVESDIVLRATLLNIQKNIAPIVDALQQKFVDTVHDETQGVNEKIKEKWAKGGDDYDPHAPHVFDVVVDDEPDVVVLPDEEV